MANPLWRRKSVAQILQDVQSGGSDGHSPGLKRSLGVKDLTLMGFAAIIGAGLFSTIGAAASDGGPAVTLLFVFTAFACGLAALCYAEFASAIPISGSAYTYSYASFGELAAWIIGWDLIIEYAIGNIVVAISWSGYFTTLLADFGIELPAWAITDYITALRTHGAVEDLLAALPAGMESAAEAFRASPTLEGLRALLGSGGAEATKAMVEEYAAWQHAPSLFGVRIILDAPAIFIVVAITVLIYLGIQESKTAGNWMVYIKLGVIVLVLVLGAIYINPDNWTPFAPNGFSGVMKGVAGVFFAYIGFDALSTMSEECKNPQRDLPRAMMLTLVICTVLYVVISLVLTGVVPYQQLNVSDPMAELVAHTGLGDGLRRVVIAVVAVAAVVATTSVLLVFQMGQPRILMSMSRDGLLPRRFSTIHKRFRTPSFATVVTGLLVGLPVFFLNFSEVTDLSSIGTLFAFVLVCGGVLVQQLRGGPDYQPRFRVFYINGKYLLPLLVLAGGVLIPVLNPEGVAQFWSFQDAEHSAAWSFFKRVPMLLFYAVALAMAYLAFRYRLGLIPALGLIVCFYLMAEVDAVSWYRFLAWLAVGLVIYFAYGRKNSRLAKESAQT